MRHIHAPPAEALEVGIGRMGAHGHAMLLSQLDGPIDGFRITAVEAAGDVGRGDVGHDLVVSAHGPGAVRLAHIGVDVDWHPIAF
jgi:hypothetical protein